MKKKLFARIEIKHGVTKRAVIMCWAVAVSIILYCMSIPIGSNNSNFLFSMVSFGAVLFGGGAAYHMVSLMIECPQTENNFEGWMRLVELLVKVYIGFALAVTCSGIGVYYKGWIGVSIIAAGYLVGFMWASNKLVDSHRFIRALIANG